MIPKNPERKNLNPVSYSSCIAKTEDGCNVGMTVLQHCLAAGYTASAIASQFPLLKSIGLFPSGYEAVAALHDIGKISPSFQLQIADALNPEDRDALISRLGLEGCKRSDIHHSTISYSSLRDVLGKDIAYIEGAHHGYLQDTKYLSGDGVLGGIAWQAARLDFLEEVRRVFGDELPTGLSRPLIDFLSGLTIVSDWISSSISQDEYEKEDPSIFLRKVNAAGFKEHHFRKDLSFKEIFGFEMRPEQKALIDSVSSPGLYILESGTGSGKTEAALYAAYKLLSAGKAAGIYFALPTTLTSRMIQGRVDSFLKAISEDGSEESKLIFSNSFLYSCVYGYEDFPERSWFDSRKRMILAPFGVGTIDQALMSVIAVKHSSVRAFGLAGKVVILDEVHSYDSYTGTLIEALIKELIALGSTVIVLSATLRKSVRAGLLGIPADRGRLSSDYPLVTSLYSDGEMKEAGALPVSERTICIKHEIDIQEAIDSAIDDAMSCKYVLWIENSVSDAQNAFARFSARCSGIVGVGLLHSRFLGFDRAGKEKEYTALFGKDGWINRKGKGFILVGTQILEQSLDIDADVLYTRLAPADMLFQRIGRLWRHDHPDRDGVPTCHIIHPDIEDVRKDPDVFGVSAAVYSGYVLYRTLCAFSPLESVNTPGDIRMILDSVYEDRNEEQWPRILSLKRDLDRRRRDMINLSRRSLSKIGVVPDDFATSRYSDMRTRQVMILARIDLDRKSVILYTGEELLLSTNGKLPIERANIALKLEQSMITVPERQCPDICSPKKLLDLLSGYVFVGGGDHGADSSDELVVLLVDDHGRLMDASGNIICGYRYSTKMGYHIIKEVSNG